MTASDIAMAKKTKIDYWEYFEYLSALDLKAERINKQIGRLEKKIVKEFIPCEKSFSVLSEKEKSDTLANIVDAFLKNEKRQRLYNFLFSIKYNLPKKFFMELVEKERANV